MAVAGGAGLDAHVHLKIRRYGGAGHDHRLRIRTGGRSPPPGPVALLLGVVVVEAGDPVEVRPGDDALRMPAGAHRLAGLLHGPHRHVEEGRGPEHELEPEPLERLRAHLLFRHPFDGDVHLGERDRPGHPLEVRRALRPFDVDDVAPRILVGLCSPQPFLDAHRRGRIRAAEDEDVRPLVAGIDGGPDPGHRLCPVHHLHPASEAAALRKALVLDHHRGEPRPRVARHRPLDVDRVAVAGVPVADDRDRHRGADVAPLVEHLPERDEPRVGGADPGRGDRETAHEGDGKSGPLHDPGTDRVVAAGEHHEAGLGEEASQSFRARAHDRGGAVGSRARAIDRPSVRAG